MIEYKKRYKKRNSISEVCAFLSTTLYFEVKSRIFGELRELLIDPRFISEDIMYRCLRESRWK
jgi:hypothetical protein